MATPDVRAAGGVVTRWHKDTLRFLVVHRPRYDDWSLPKGKIDADDVDLADTAVREVAEETGVTARLGPHVRAVDYRDRSGRRKRVHWWKMVPVSEVEHTPDREVDRIKWVKQSKLAGKLTYGTDKRVIKRFAEARRSLLVVRHAKAGKRGSHDPDHKRPLTGKGRRQAEALVTQLADHDIQVVVTSPFTRCRDTVAPLAAARGLEVVRDKRLVEGADISDVLGLVDELPESAVLCTHRDVIDTLLDHWDGDKKMASGMDFPHRRRKKASTWWVTTAGTTARAAAWIPPG